MLRFRTFGAIDLHRESGERLEDLLSQPKRLALLAYLAERQPSGPVRREQILSLLWPESAPSSARHALSSTLSRLRQTLGEEIVRGSGEETLWLDPDEFHSDAAAFRDAIEADRPRKALDLYRGPFLEGFRPPDARPFEEWVEKRRESYRHHAYEAALARDERTRADGAFAEAEEAYRTALDLEPLKEKAAAGLIRVLAEQGERTDALQLYEAFTDRLEKELALAPSDELRDLAERVRSGRGGAEAGGSGGEAVEVDGQDQEEAAESQWSGRPLPVVVTLLAAVLIGAGAWLLRSDGSEPAVAYSPPADRPGVAVLPFDDMGVEASSGNLGLAFTESIIAELALAENLSVLPRTSVMPYRETDLQLPAVADSLGVEHVLEGSIRQHRDSVRISVQFVHADGGRRSWARTFDREFSDIFQVEGEVVRRVADALEARLTEETRKQFEDRPTDNPTAYRHYLPGRELLIWAERYTAEDRENPAAAIELFHEAIRLDSTFALAHVGLSRAFKLQADLTGAARWSDSSLWAARRAVEVDPNLADSHRVLGRHLHLERGRISEAERHLKRAVALKPGGGWCRCELGYLYYWAGQIPKSVRWYWRALPQAPEKPEVRHGLELAMIVFGEEAATRAWVERFQALRADPRPELFHPLVRGTLRHAAAPPDGPATAGTGGAADSTVAGRGGPARWTATGGEEALPRGSPAGTRDGALERRCGHPSRTDDSGNRG